MKTSAKYLGLAVGP